MRRKFIADNRKYGSMENILKKLLFFVVYVITLAIPAALYLVSLQGGFDSYSLSVVLGVSAFVMLCNQFILASKPRLLVSAVGIKTILSVHSTAPVIILVFAIIHKFLKEANGLSDDTLQGSLGGIVWALLLIITVLTVLFMAKTFWMKNRQLSALRKLAYEKTGITYKKMRALHNVTVVAVVIIIAHVLLASSSSFAANPEGILWLMGWAALSLCTYLVYRLKGRTL